VEGHAEDMAAVNDAGIGGPSRVEEVGTVAARMDPAVMTCLLSAPLTLQA
jgi:hypothetical protein